jgi:predicted membrane-bound spermidine synthase
MLIRAAVFLITLSGLVFEIGLTRIYSATIWYHFAFVAISMALLGWGLGGLAVHLLKRSWPPSSDRAAVLTMLYGVAIPLCLRMLVAFPFEFSRLALYFLMPLVPFFLGGMALAMIFDLNRRGAGSLYFADLLGASLGAVSVTALLQLVGGEESLLLAAVAPLVASALLSRRLRAVAIAETAIVLLLAITNGTLVRLHVIPGTIKAMRRQMDENPGSRVTQTGWNAYSRIDAVEGVAPKFIARLYIDSDAWTSVMPWDGRLESVHEMRDSYRALPFHFNPGGETLIIGPGGGPDVVAALASGSRKVTAVEMNPLMIQFVRHYGAQAGSLYDRPDVEVIQSEGRNFISRTDRKFDTIFLGFVDSWASVASGGLSLSENYLYTTQAFRAYFDHLKENGVLVILRWDSDIPRLVANSVALLGAGDASQRVAALMEKRGTREDPSQMLFMLRKRPFTKAEADQLVIWPLAKPFIVPGYPVPQPYTDLLNGRKSMETWQAESPTLIGPVFDDSPFYFAVERPWGMPKPIARRLFQWLLAPNLVLLALFAAFGKPKRKPAAPYAASVAYFACLGFGFISVELALLQNLTLLLGHPIFTLAILLFTLLAAGGLGSAVSALVPPRGACLAVAALGIVEAVVLPRLVPLLLPLPIAARIAIAMVLVAPLGFVMGMPFPRGLQSTGRGSLPAPPFFWGLNGVMSVIGSVVTVFVALRWGFQSAMLIGCLAYVLAGLASRTALAVDAPDFSGRASVL